MPLPLVQGGDELREQSLGEDVIILLRWLTVVNPSKSLVELNIMVVFIAAMVKLAWAIFLLKRSLALFS